MLPGRTFTPEEILRIVWRRKWLIIVPVVLIGMTTLALSWQLPKMYRSETMILVIPQRVPESYVRATVTSRIEDRLASLNPQILSRSRLEPIILEFNLYEERRRTVPMESVVESMRLAIQTKVERGDAFRISYVNSDPYVAQKVAERLAAMYIEENLKDREVQAEGTNRFLDSQLEEARKRLLDQENKVEEYKKRYAGQLPSQLQANLQTIGSAQVQLQTLSESINRDRDQRLVLERQLAELQFADAPVAAPAPVVIGEVSHDLPPGTPTGQLLESARAKLQALREKYKPDHPEVMTAVRLVRELEVRVAEESRAAQEARAKVPPAPPPAPKPITPAERTRERRRLELEAEISNIDGQLARRKAQEEQLRAVIDAYQARVEAVPTREAELTELTRDYATTQAAYASLSAKR